MASARQAGEWAEEFALMQEAAPEGVAWNAPLNAERFRPSLRHTLDQALSGETERHFLARCEGTLAAALLVRQSYFGLEGALIQREGTAGRVEAALLQAAPTAGAMVLDTTVWISPQAMLQMGFQKKRVLVWMSRALPSEPAPPSGSAAV
jgi:hypothetical protein